MKPDHVILNIMKKSKTLAEWKVNANITAGKTIESKEMWVDIMMNDKDVIDLRRRLKEEALSKP